MKQIHKLIIACFLSLLFLIPAAAALFYYTKPMEDVSYHLSFIAEDGQPWQGEKGWTVFIQDKETKKNLISDGMGGYSGLEFPGQTFYFSRELSEEMDDPTIQIGVANRTISIFLNDTLLYTDCPELDNRIGYLQLPMLDYDRAEPVTVSLPPDYEGQTLTIAQSTDTFNEKGTQTVYPLEVTLYCGYSYESELIASAANTMIPAVLFFSLILVLLAVFIWNASLGSLAFSLPVLALTAFFQMCGVLAQANFVLKYLGEFPIDVISLCRFLSIGMLLILFTLHAKPLRILFSVLSALQLAAVLASVLVQIERLFPYGKYTLFFQTLPQIIGFAALVIAVICGFFLWHRKNTFFRQFSIASLVITGGYALFLLACIPLMPDYIASVISRIAGDFSLFLPDFSLQLIWNLCLFSSIFAIFSQIFEKEADRRTEGFILSEKNRLAVESYENLRRQTEEVMMIRHDTAKHYDMLRALAEESPEKVKLYLDELTGQVQQIRPVITTGNQILDIILNGKLKAASDLGISIDIVRSQAPEILPLTDTETCCLITNILDNAITAASSGENARPFIRLDLHCKDSHFVFSCENSTSVDKTEDAKIPMPEHGYGLKIIRQIMKRRGEMFFIEEHAGRYKISIVIPLN